MDVQKLIQIVADEGLEVPVLYGNGTIRDRTVVLETVEAGWRVYVANERGGMLAPTLRHFDSESEALDYVLLKLQQAAKYRRLQAALHDKRNETHPS